MEIKEYLCLMKVLAIHFSLYIISRKAEALYNIQWNTFFIGFFIEIWTVRLSNEKLE